MPTSPAASPDALEGDEFFRQAFGNRFNAHVAEHENPEEYAAGVTA